MRNDYSDLAVTCLRF